MRASQSQATPEPYPVASQRPSGEYATQSQPPVTPGGWTIASAAPAAPAFRSQARTSPASSADARCRPSAENASEPTAARCPLSRCSRAPPRDVPDRHQSILSARRQPEAARREHQPGHPPRVGVQNGTAAAPGGRILQVHGAIRTCP